MSNLSNENESQSINEKNGDFPNIVDIKEETCVERVDILHVNVSECTETCYENEQEEESGELGAESVNYRPNKIRIRRGQKKQTKFAPICLAENNNDTRNNKKQQAKIKVVSDLTASKTEVPKDYNKELFNALQKKKKRKEDADDDYVEPVAKKTRVVPSETKTANNILISSLLGQITEINQPVEVTKTPPAKQGRGRPKKSKQPPAKKGPAANVTCAVCKIEVAPMTWLSHKQRYHNNLAWKIGEEPIDLNNQTTVMSILHSLYKQKKPLYCEICGESKKSVIGYLSHKSICNKTEEEIEATKITCELCGRSMMPVSMGSHLTLSHSKKEYTLDNLEDEQPVEVLSKRKAARKAEDLLDIIKRNGQIVAPPENKTKNLKRLILVNFNFNPNKSIRTSFKKELAKSSQVSCRFYGCDYQAATVAQLISHVVECSKKPLKNFTCKFCVIPYKTYEECARHVKQLHIKDKSDSEKEYSDDEAKTDSDNNELFDDKKELRKSCVPGQRRYQTILVPFLNKFKSNNKNRKILYLPAYNWMLKFASNNLNETNIFPDIVAKRHWHQMPALDIQNYLPRVKISMETNRIESKTFEDPLSLNYVSWKRYRLFESELHVNGNSTVFCGGPINALAWVPTPLNATVDQIAAVSVSLEPDKDYVLMRRYSDKGLLQFWNFGPLDLKTSSSHNPKLEFCIGHDYGFVYCLEWCPSGCYTQNQLGLLAMACSDSFVYVYAICQPNTIDGRIFKTKPAFKLDLNTLDELNLAEQKYHATRVSWTKACGHKYVAVGYSNGVVAMFDLSSIKSNENQVEIPVITPYRKFAAHWHAITALALHHMNGGRRWLMTASYDKLNKFWDLNSPIEPIVCYKKHEITEGVWPCNWLGAATSQDDATITIINATSYGQMRDVGVNPPILLYANSRINSLTYSDWGNMFIQGTSMGELHASYPNQLLQNLDLDKNIRIKKFYISYVGLIEKELSTEERLEVEKRKQQALKNELPKQHLSDLTQNLTYSDLNPHYYKAEPSSYRESDERYGLVFADLKLETIKDVRKEHLQNMTYKSEKLSYLKPNMFPIQSVNKVAFNPNKQSFLYVASGYQAGFLRISCLRFLGSQLSLK